MQATLKVVRTTRRYCSECHRFTVHYVLSDPQTGLMLQVCAECLERRGKDGKG